MLLVIILGGVSLLNIPLKLIPDINPPVGVVVTSYPGAGPKEVLEKITKPLEANLATLPGIKTLTSISQEGSNLILLEFSWTTNIDDIQSEVSQRIDQTTLPDDAGNPRFMKFDPSQLPVIQLSLSANEEPEILRELADQLRLELLKVEGIASVNLSGTTIQEVRVELNQTELQKYGISQSDVVELIQANNLTLPGDTILTGNKELTTRIISSLDSIETLENLALTVNPQTGEKVTLTDISDVKLIQTDDRTITRTNENPSVLLSVMQQSDANTQQVSQAFTKALNELLEKEKYAGIEADTLFDQGDYIQLAISNITTTLITGGILAMIVLFFFLKSFKSPLVIGIAIPYSVIVTFVLMFFSNFTLNILTLGGLALGIGMLVDNSIVVIENIYRHLSMGKDKKEAAAAGAKEVGSAITASTLTTIAVFLPVVFISGIVGELFTEFALTISFSLFASLIVALTVVPMLASRWLKEPKVQLEEERKNSVFMKKLEQTIRWMLRHRAAVLSVVIILLVLGGLGLTTVGTQFIPNTDEGFFTLRVELENGTALSETEKVVEAIEENLKGEADIDTYVSLIGTTQEGSFRGTSNGNVAELYIKMKELGEREQSTFEFVDDKKKELERAAHGVNRTADISFNLQSSTGTSPNTLSFNVRDLNEDRLNEAVEEIYDALLELPDVTELSTDLMEQLEEIQITVDREKAFAEGLAPAQIAMIVNDVTRGTQATQMMDDEGNILGVFVEYDPAVTKNLDELKKLLLKKPDGSYISLDKVTTIERGTGPLHIQRINQQNAVQFTLKYKSTTNLGDMSREVDEKIASLDLNEETDIVYSGDRELLDSTMDDLVMAFVLALILVYFVMAAQFESLKYPFVIMFTVPLMIIGVAVALIVTRTPIGLTAMIGIIVLAGIVVNNAIVLVDYINQKKNEGLKSYDAIVVAVKDRVRPILMTALTTILGLIPLAIGIGEGAEIMQPMGISVIGGLISSTLLTLFIIPIVYSLFDKETRKLNKMYATPDGHLVPAYILEDRFEKAEDDTDENLPSTDTSKYSKTDMTMMLEELMKLLNDDKKKED